jgi:hypothetical protein
MGKGSARVIQNSHMVDAETLRQRSGKKSRSAIRKWASAQGFRVFDGKDGPWTTLEALNAALGVGSANDEAYDPNKVL